MTIIRTTCECCGDVEVAAWSASVELTDPAEGLMHFSCPECGASQSVAADAASIALLRAAGVPITECRRDGANTIEALDLAYIERACEYLASIDTLCTHEALLG